VAKLLNFGGDQIVTSYTQNVFRMKDASYLILNLEKIHNWTTH